LTCQKQKSSPANFALVLNVVDEYVTLRLYKVRFAAHYFFFTTNLGSSFACLQLSDDDGGFGASLSSDSTQIRIGCLDETCVFCREGKYGNAD